MNSFPATQANETTTPSTTSFRATHAIETEKVDPSDGFIVCLQTAWTGIYNIGVTSKTPAEFLKNEHNSYLFPPPKPYTIIYSKRIEEPEEKSKIFYELMHKYAVFARKERTFYKIPDLLSVITDIITDMEFTSWKNTCKEEEQRSFNRKDLKPFRFRGKLYKRNYLGHTWNEYGDTWIGLYNYWNKTLDTTALKPDPEPEYECDSD